MEQTHVVAPDIVCDGCANAVKKALGLLDGVLHVEVNVPTKTVIVSHHATVPHQSITAALDRAGFPVTS